MCGIAGVFNRAHREPVQLEVLENMLALIQHRGPDQAGIYRDANCSMVNARLSILDISGGQQPISNQDETLWIVYNGEIFNDLALKRNLINLGHQFHTETDTEVILHLYEQYGPQFLEMINGQYAIAIWDRKKETLFLARDRIGIRPLFYSNFGKQFVFSSEIKAFLAIPNWQAEIDPQVLQQIFTYWGPLTPNSTFKNVHEVKPGHYMLVSNTHSEEISYWEPHFEKKKSAPDENDLIEEFGNLLIDSSQIRLRADVPVGAYLSGGLDSSTIAAIITSYTNTPLETFSIQFEDPRYDEKLFQDQMVERLNVHHNAIFCRAQDIGNIFSEVIWHTETPILRTSPAPMYLLSRLVHQHDYKVVLTGEGADEILGGYDIFKENKIRRFIANHPETANVSKLYACLYPEIPQLNARSQFLQAFFGQDIQETKSPFYSHHLRWSNTARSLRFLKTANQTLPSDPNYPIELPKQFSTWTPLAQAQFLEMKTFLTPYLLSSQGDRMAMANSVEGRYPFLDYRLMEFANSLPDQVKLRGLQEKWILRKFASKFLPIEIWRRRKKPYRAPIQHSFLNQASSPQTAFYFNEQNLINFGYFNTRAAVKLYEKALATPQLSEMEEMAFVGILSTQILHDHFCNRNFPKVKLDRGIPLKLIDLAISV
ncbi:MAG: asparagine synthase (glutamine-hydrolyzing) [Chloroflexi bacterium 44-23]|nr:MAG: asparagine synthase (glutamine-hydrolyzing) [Chloroflexi bacterium 44-23]